MSLNEVFCFVCVDILQNATTDAKEKQKENEKAYRSNK